MAPIEITATSLVPPPTSMTIRPTGSPIGHPGADGGGDRLLDQLDVAGAGGERRLLDRAPLDLGDARRGAHDQPRAGAAVVERPCA